MLLFYICIMVEFETVNNPIDLTGYIVQKSNLFLGYGMTENFDPTVICQ